MPIKFEGAELHTTPQKLAYHNSPMCTLGQKGCSDTGQLRYQTIQSVSVVAVSWRATNRTRQYKHNFRIGVVFIFKPFVVRARRCPTNSDGNLLFATVCCVFNLVCCFRRRCTPALPWQEKHSTSCGPNKHTQRKHNPTVCLPPQYVICVCHLFVSFANTH